MHGKRRKVRQDKIREGGRKNKKEERINKGIINKIYDNDNNTYTHKDDN